MDSLIFQANTYQANFFDKNEQISVAGNEKKLIITFNFYGQKSLSGKGWGGEYWHQQGYLVIALTTTKNDWYHNIDSDSILTLSKFIRKLKEEREIEVVCGYGTSMGGFAAILFSEALSLDKVIAFSPQYSISELWDTRWKYESDSLLNQKKIKDVSFKKTEFYIFYDPHDVDRIHVDNYVNEIKKNLFLIKVPWSGHPSCTLLSDGGILFEISTSIINNKFNIKMYDFKKIRNKSRHYYINISKLLFNRGRFAKSLVYVEKALEMGYKFFSFHELKLQCLLRLNPLTYLKYLKDAMNDPLELGNYPHNYLNILNKNSDEILKYYEINDVLSIFLNNIKTENDLNEYKNFINKYSIENNYNEIRR